MATPPINMFGSPDSSSRIRLTCTQFNYYLVPFHGGTVAFGYAVRACPRSIVFQRNGTVGLPQQVNLTSFSLGNSGSGVRNLQVGANPVRYGTTVGCSLTSQRADAWASGLLAAAAGIGPDRNGDCASYKRYFNDMNASTWAAAVDISRALPKYGTKYGLWSVPYQANWQLVDHWQMAYLGAALALRQPDHRGQECSARLAAQCQMVRSRSLPLWRLACGLLSDHRKNSRLPGRTTGAWRQRRRFSRAKYKLDERGPFTLQPFSNYVPANGDIYMFTDTVTGVFSKSRRPDSASTFPIMSSSCQDPSFISRVHRAVHRSH